MAPPDYSSAEWADIIPIPQNEGGPNPLASIAYTAEYSQASDYLRAVMAANEKSARVLALTEHIISMNPAHYTVWIYRAAVLEALSTPPETELQWLTNISLKHLKNYQIWQHRHVIMSQLGKLPKGELEFLDVMLAKDVKNYHVWSYRQWLVRHFDLFASTTNVDEDNTELRYTEKMLDDDVRNNSAWNHRYFVIFGKEGRKEVSKVVLDREIAYAKEKVALAPQNQSAWNYLKGVLRFGSRSLGELKEFAGRFAALDGDGERKVTSSHALDVLGEIWTEEKDFERAGRALELLGERYDPIRKNYWNWKKARLQAVAA